MQFLYLILSLYYGRKNPLFYLIFPIALVSGPGALIDPRTVIVGEDIFTMSKNMYKDVVILYLFLVVLYLKNRYTILLLPKSPVLLYGSYILLLILLTLAASGTSYEAVNLMRLFTHMVFGFFLLLFVFYSANNKQFISFFNMLFWATGALSIFYVINSAKIFPIFYQETLYQDVDFGQDSFFRDFSTIPYFSHLLFILAFTSTILKSVLFNRRAVLFVLITYPFVLLYTFTRGLLLGTIIECILILAIIAFYNPQRILKKSTIFLAMAGLLIWGIVQNRFSNELGYYTSRIEDAKTEGANESNVLIRIAYHVKAYDIVKHDNALLTGAGLNKRNEEEMSTLGAWTADSTIPFLLIYTGVIGIILYYYLGFHFVIKAWQQIKQSFNPISITLFATILMAIVSSFIMGGYRWGDPFIFFPYVLVAVVGQLCTKENAYKQIRLRILRSKSNKQNKHIN